MPWSCRFQCFPEKAISVSALRVMSKTPEGSCAPLGFGLDNPCDVYFLQARACIREKDDPDFLGAVVRGRRDFEQPWLLPLPHRQARYGRCRACQKKSAARIRGTVRCCFTIEV